MSPASTAARMRVELTFSPPSSTGGTTRSSSPSSPHSRVRRATSPAAPRPNRKSSPQHKALAWHFPTNIRRTKSSASMSRTWAKGMLYTRFRPAASSSLRLSRGVTTPLPPAGLLGKVNAPASQGHWRAARITAMCPRCSPSKEPSAKAQGLSSRMSSNVSIHLILFLIPFPPPLGRAFTKHAI